MKRRITTGAAVAAAAALYGSSLGTALLRGQIVTEPPAVLQSLKGVAVPVPPNLGDYVVDRDWAIVLGKALFWDMNVGSDEIQACASCHFAAGADSRIKNQISPDLNHVAGPPFSETFDPTATGNPGGPNYTLRAADFPFHRLTDPANRDSAVLYTTNEIGRAHV